MNILTTSGARLLYAIPMALFGILHFMNASDMAGMVPSFIPGGVFWVYLTGLGLILAAVKYHYTEKSPFGLFSIGCHVNPIRIDHARSRTKYRHARFYAKPIEGHCISRCCIVICRSCK